MCTPDCPALVTIYLLFLFFERHILLLECLLEMDAPISTLEFCLYLLLIINNIYFWVAYIIVCLLFKSILSGTIAYFLLEASETSKLRHCIFPSTLFKMHVLKSIVHFELFYVKGIICEVSKFRILKNIC